MRIHSTHPGYGKGQALTLVVIRVYISNSFSSRSVSFRKRRPM
ncbi:hypothetical protein ROS217_00245 [Roseovarius sp. 217]|nr:hypothetical protein ROS217_00245 [Roseovarius sp. 217]